MSTPKVVLITGGSSGIGQATAINFGHHGFYVAVSGRNVERLEQLKNNKAFFSTKILTIKCDITKEQEVKQMVTRTIDTFGRLDVLVNNAGITYMEGLENCNLDHFDEIMNTNVKGVVMTTKCAVPHLLQSKGCVVNVSSIAGIRPMAGILAYAVSKAALDQFTRSAALELGQRGVRVNSVNPGVVETEIHMRAGMTRKEYDDYLSLQPNRHLLGRSASLDDVTNAIWFLANETSTFITGHLLTIDGGRTLVTPSKI